MSGLIIVINQLIGAGNDGRVRIIAGFRVENRLLKQLRREDRFLYALVLVADADAEAVTIPQVLRLARVYLAARGDHRDRIRDGQQQTGLEEVGQEFMIQRNGQLMIIDHGDAVQIGKLPRQIFMRPKNMLRAVDLPADLLNLRGHHQENAESIIPSGDGRSIGIEEIVVQTQVIRLIPDLVLHHQNAFHDGFVDQVDALVLVPVDQVIAMNQGSYVDIGGIVAEHLGKEIALGDGRMADSQLVRIEILF